MNERIQQLAKQAQQLANDELAHLERVHNRLYSFTEGREIYNQKFAELIVRECCDIFVELRTRPADLAVKDVKKHFGVEE